MAHKIVWTVLPNGVDGQRLKLSLYVSMRLDSSLGMIDDWPGLVNAVNSFQLRFDDGTPGGGQVVSLRIDSRTQLSTGTTNSFNRVFPPGNATPISDRPFFRNDLVARRRLSFPVKQIREAVEGLYRDVAENFPDTPPPVIEGYDSSSVDSYGDVLVGIGDPIFSRQAGPGSQTPSPENTHPSLNDPSFDPDGEPAFYQAFRFYRREIDNQRSDPNEAPTAVPLKEPDAHEALGMLGDQPFLLRRFALILDASVATPSDTTLTRVRLEQPNFPASANLEHELPWTEFTREGGVFLPAPDTARTLTDQNGNALPEHLQGADQDVGLLKLGDTERFEVQQLDADGSALKLANFAVMVLQDPPNDIDSELNNQGVFSETELPNLRTGGFTIARVGRSKRMGSQLQKAQGFEGNVGTNQSDGTLLRAEDVTRGYRLDVLDESEHRPEWRSLCLRTGHYVLGETAPERVPRNGEIHEEAYIKASSATAEPGPLQDAATAPLYVHESLFHWDGWSQVIKPPGRDQRFEPQHEENGTTVAGNDVVARIPNTPATQFKVEPIFEVEPRTLPKLRFGHSYRFRARVVDLAGNSLALSTTTESDELRTAPHVYRRWEPVPQPVLLFRQPIVEGESLEHVVIRSKSGHARLPNDIFFSRNERHVAPPQASVDLVLTHGMLDPFFDDPRRSFNIAVKSEGTFLDREIWDTHSGRLVPVSGIELKNPLQRPGAPPLPPPVFPAKRGDGILPGQYVIFKDESVRLPYLPDPVAVGIAIKDAPEPLRHEEFDPVLEDPDIQVGLHKLFFNGHWPDVDLARIVVEATQQDTPSIRIEGQKIVIRLPPATILPLRFSSLIKRNDLGKMAIWNLMSAEKQAEQESLALDGQHWMITPRRSLVAVHAVEKPLRAAKFTALAVNPVRKRGETFVFLNGTIDNHSRSTGQLDIEASWIDPVDRLTEPRPSEESREGHVFSHRPEYRDSLTDVPLVPSFSTGDRDLTPKQDFGDTKHRYVDYRADATTRYREYFPLSVTENPDNIRLRGAPFQVNVLSSARPEIPLVLYVIPTFKWQTEDHGKTSRRVGRGLRVYLSRPWYSSGIDELLGVVLPVLNQDGTLANEDSRRFITEWGDDPVWTGSGPSRHIRASDFSNPDAVSDPNAPLNLAEDETIPGFAGPGNPAPQDERIRVHALGFKVEFNEERQVWFADIEFEPVASYFPFIRFSLARYQPHSTIETNRVLGDGSFVDWLTGVHLSRVVRAEFAQLVNDRSATILVDRAAIQVTVVGLAARSHLGQTIVDEVPLPTGPTPTPPPGYVLDRDAGAGRLLVAHVERNPHDGSDLDWQQVGDVVVLPSFSPDAPMPDAETLWTGAVPRPSRGPRAFDYRLVVREIEVFDTDSDVAETLPITVPAQRLRPPFQMDSESETTFIRGRVVYLDTFALGHVEC